MKRLKESACVAIIAAVTMARAAECTLPTPPTSEFADTESAVNVPFYDWPELGRRVTLTLAANATPLNCVQIAFGQDTNGDENLEPEETMAVVGVDAAAEVVAREAKLGLWAGENPINPYRWRKGEMRILYGKFALVVGRVADERIHGIIWA